MRPQGLCLPIISMAVRLQIDASIITAVNISMGPVGPVPYLAEPAMATLVGGPATTQQFDKAATVALEGITLRTSKYRATQEYRMQMIRTYLPIILARAADRATAASAVAEGFGS
jgi:CO/xanthine dehydrogenase FAD-binding subunit